MSHPHQAETRGIDRRTVLEASAAAVVAGSLAGIPGGAVETGSLEESESDASDWPTFGGDDANTGTTGARGPDEPTERWFRETDPIVHPPTVVDGVVYVAEQSANADGGGALAAYDARTGAPEWRHEFDAHVSGSATVVDDTVYVAVPSVTCGDDGRRRTHRVHAFGTEGSRRWTVEVDGLGWVTPTVVGDLAYIQTDLGTYALDVETGALAWARAVGGAFPDTLAASDGTVYAGAANGAFALDADTGQRFWWVEYDGLFHAPVVDEDTVYAAISGPGGAILALDAETGDRLWHASGGPPTQPPVVAGEALFAAFASEREPLQANVVAFEVETGEQRWTFEPDGAGTTVAASAGTVYARTAGRIHALDPADGHERWRFDAAVEAPLDGHDDAEGVDTWWHLHEYAVPPVVADGAVFAGEPSGGLYAVGGA